MKIVGLITEYNPFHNGHKYQIDKMPSWDIQTISVDGTGATKPTYVTGGLKAYVMMPNEESVQEAKLQLRACLQN